MTINASARKYKLTIDGVDCTALLASCDGGYSHYESGSGLSTISATLNLKKVPGSSINLDDRTNNDWARGNLIKIEVANSVGTLTPAPVVGHLYILNAEFDGKNILKIEAGCILSLLSFRTPAGSGVYFKLGNLIDLDSIASALLEKAGVPVFAVSVAGDPLKAPVPKLTNESYVQFFGKLCYANGFIAYQDNLGIVKTQKINFTSPALFTSLLGKDDIAYERLTGAEHPCEKIIVTGTISSVREKQQFSQTVTEQFGIIPGNLLPSLIGRTTLTEQINATTRKVMTSTKTEKPESLIMPSLTTSSALIVAEHKIDEKEYEITDSNFPTTGLIDKISPDEGRLLRSVSSLSRPLGAVLLEYIENGGLVTLPIYQLIDEEKEDVFYFYPIESPNAPESPGSISFFIPKQDLIIKSKKYQARGIILKNPPDTHQDYAPATSELIEQTTQSWIQTSNDDWQVKTETTKVFGSSPDALESFEENYGYIPGVVLTFLPVPGETTVSRGKSEQFQPLTAERWSSEYSLTERLCKAVKQFPPLAGDVYRDREREYVVDSFLTSEQQAKAIAEVEGSFLYGRHKGVQCTIALRDELFTSSPLFRADWIELSGAKQAYLADGLSVALTVTQFAVSFDGIWLGSVVSESTGDVVPPYKVISEFAGGTGDGGTLKVFPYSLQPVEVNVAGGTGDGGIIQLFSLIRISGGTGDGGDIGAEITGTCKLNGGIGDGGDINAIAPILHQISGGTGDGGSIATLGSAEILLLDDNSEFLIDNGEYLVLD